MKAIPGLASMMAGLACVWYWCNIPEPQWYLLASGIFAIVVGTISLMIAGT